MRLNIKVAVVNDNFRSKFMFCIYAFSKRPKGCTLIFSRYRRIDVSSSSYISMTPQQTRNVVTHLTPALQPHGAQRRCSLTVHLVGDVWAFLCCCSFLVVGAQLQRWGLPNIPYRPEIWVICQRYLVIAARRRRIAHPLPAARQPAPAQRCGDTGRSLSHIPVHVYTCRWMWHTIDGSHFIF